MAYELFEALKKEFFPSYKEEEEDYIQIEVPAEEKQDEDLPKCDYCNNNINARAYRLHGKVICSPCLNSRYNDYTNKTFKRITNKSLDDVKKKI